MNNLAKQIGNKIQVLRKFRDLSQERLGEITGLTKNYIGLLERGQRNPSIETLAKIAQALNVSLKDLFDF